MKIAEMRALRGRVVKRMGVLAALPTLTVAQQKDFDKHDANVKKLDGQIERAVKAQQLARESAQPVGATRSIPAAPETDEYVKEKSLVVGGIVRLAAMSKGNMDSAANIAPKAYGERHPVALAMGKIKALSTGMGSAGGFVVPPDFATSLIALLYPLTAIRKAGARVIAMPNGTMTLPKMTGGSQAQWVGETRAPAESQPQYGQVVATAKKLMALVPVSNDMMRYANPGFDAKVRDDVVMQLALAEDAAGIRSMGTQFTPRGLRSFVLPDYRILSTADYTIETVGQELGGLQTKIEESNVPGVKPCFIMRPRTKNYLMNLQNAHGLYVYRDEMTAGKLLGWPFFTTTQVPNNLEFGGHSDCSEIYAADMNEFVIYESRQIELAISTEGSYVDANGQTQNAFSQDMSLIRALTAVDFQMDHDEGVAVLEGVRWAPTLQ